MKNPHYTHLALRDFETQSLIEFFDLTEGSSELLGGISEGSNAGCHAKEAAQTADLILWQPNGARHFAGGLLPALPVRRVHGVSSAFDALAGWLVSRTAQKKKRPESMARKERAL